MQDIIIYYYIGLSRRSIHNRNIPKAFRNVKLYIGHSRIIMELVGLHQRKSDRFTAEKTSKIVGMIAVSNEIRPEKNLG